VEPIVNLAGRQEMKSTLDGAEPGTIFVVAASPGQHPFLVTVWRKEASGFWHPCDKEIGRLGSYSEVLVGNFVMEDWWLS